MAPINVGSLKDQPPCHHCGALLWPSETSQVCCKNGSLFDKTRPLESPLTILEDPPPDILQLVTKPSHARYLSHYNHSLAMASIGGDFPETNATTRLQGKMYHTLGSLAPPAPGQRPPFTSTTLIMRWSTARLTCRGLPSSLESWPPCSHSSGRLTPT